LETDLNVARAPLIFISHSSADEVFVRELREQLLSQGLQPWTSETEIQAGENWAERVSKALKDASAMVVVLSPDAVKSSWVTRDIDFALSSSKFKDRFFPIVVRRTPHDDIPWILQRLNLLETRDPKVAGKKIADALKESALVEDAKR
jgi:hypothetical protein